MSQHSQRAQRGPSRVSIVLGWVAVAVVVGLVSRILGRADLDAGHVIGAALGIVLGSILVAQNIDRIGDREAARRAARRAAERRAAVPPPVPPADEPDPLELEHWASGGEAPRWDPEPVPPPPFVEPDTQVITLTDAGLPRREPGETLRPIDTAVFRTEGERAAWMDEPTGVLPRD